MVLLHHKRLATPACAPWGPGIRVVTIKRVCVVANLAQGPTLSCGLRLASIAFSSQRRVVLFTDRFLMLEFGAASILV